MKNYNFLWLAVCLFLACTRETDIDLIPQNARLVVNGHFSDADSVQLVSITNAIPIGVSPLQLRNISDAVVEVYEDQRFLGQAQYMPPALIIPGAQDLRAYYAWDYPVAAGKTYEIRVSAPGYPAVSARDRLPDMAPATIATPRYLGFNPANSTIAVEIDLEDLDAAPNWYHLTFFIRVKNTETRSPTIMVSPDGDELVSSDANGIILNFGSNFGLLIDDKTFSNGSRTLLLTLEASGIGFNTPGTFELQAELRYVSRAYYDYHVSVVKYLEIRDNAFAQPALIFNNIQNGLGNFSGYRVARSAWIETR
jgi:hypothetical protein